MIDKKVSLQKSIALKLLKILRYLSFFSLLLLLVSVVTVGQERQPYTPPAELKVVIDDNYPPFSFRGSDGLLQGYCIDLWNEWENQTGTKVTITGVDWGLAQKWMFQGKFDVIDTIFMTEERLKYLDYTAPYYSIEVPIFFHRDISGIAFAQDLSGFVVGVKSGDAVVSFLNNQGITTLQEYPNYEAIILAAKEGILRVFSLDKPPALYFLHKHNLLDQFRSTQPLYVGELHRAVLKGNTTLLSHIEAGFKKIPVETYQLLEEKWFGKALFPFINTTLFLRILVGLFALLLILFLWIFSLRKAVKLRTRELSEEKEFVSVLLDSIVEGILLFDTKGNILSCNRGFERLVAFPLSRFLPQPLHVVCTETPPFTLQDARNHLKQALEKGSHRFDWVTRHRKGRLIPTEISLRAFHLQGKTRIIATIRDISDRIRYIETLQTSIKEKDALMRELLHRTKNNLQLVNSLLSLYLGSSQDPYTRTALSELQNRISSIAIIHEMLCSTGDQLGMVDLKVYLERLIELFKEGFSLEKKNITLTFKGNPLEVTSKMAVLLGLSVNELVSNAVKHAFPTPGRGSIQVALYQPTLEEGILEVQDTGKGFSPGFRPEQADTIGFLTLFSLVDQLEGKLTFSPTFSTPTFQEPGNVAPSPFPGLTATLRFPLPK
ncbi:MAG: transporter substrate-binding domain-containing protein [Spirochaetales bacterium]